MTNRQTAILMGDPIARHLVHAREHAEMERAEAELIEQVRAELQYTTSERKRDAKRAYCAARRRKRIEQAIGSES